jgi:hypothetical protein|tara:strand:- start:350 stop:790 length:441 start_codon:yes stop_codon:yes gene_type:complete
MEVFEFFFRSKLPVLFRHFKNHGVTPDVYYFEWTLTLFVRFVPLDICTRIWDSYLLLGEAYFVRAALGILRLYGASLRAMEMEEIVRFLQHLPAGMDGDGLFMAIEDICITPGSFKRALRGIEGHRGAVRGASLSVRSGGQICVPS